MTRREPDRFWFGAVVCLCFAIFAMSPVLTACGPDASTEAAQEATPDSGTVTDQAVPKDESNPPADKEPPKEQDPGEQTSPEQPPTEGPPAEREPPKPTGLKINAASTKIIAPFDAVPGPDAKVVYYTAVTKDTEGESIGTLFSTAPDGKSKPKELAKGFSAPVGVMVSTDGKTVYVADIGSGVKEVDGVPEEGKVGGIFAVPSGGGKATLLKGTEGYKPRSMDLVKEKGTDVIYFTGFDTSDPENEIPGVFKVFTDNPGQVKTILKGKPFSDLGGVVVMGEDDVFVINTSSDGEDTETAVIRVTGGKATVFVTGIRVGSPAGMVTTTDKKTLLISGLADDGSGQAVVYQVDVASKKITPISKGLEGNENSGGVHRAHNRNTFAWSNCAMEDEDGNGAGTVYLIDAEPSK